jgi:heme exporter protein D
MMESMLEFLRQGGYAFFVWGAFSVTFLLLIAETVQLRSSRRTILSRVGRLVQLRGQRNAAPSPTQTAPTQAVPPQTASTPKAPVES